MKSTKSDITEPEEPIVLDPQSLLTKRKLLLDASLMGDLDTVELLLNQGVDPNYNHEDEGTALIVAVKKKNYQLIESIFLFTSMLLLNFSFALESSDRLESVRCEEADAALAPNHAMSRRFIRFSFVPSYR
jgi:ankyrin repeat protein